MGRNKAGIEGSVDFLHPQKKVLSSFVKKEGSEDFHFSTPFEVELLQTRKAVISENNKDKAGLRKFPEGLLYLSNYAKSAQKRAERVQRITVYITGLLQFPALLPFRE